MGPENNVVVRSCWIMECLLPYLCMVTVPRIIMVGLERILDYKGVGLVRFHCTSIRHLVKQVIRVKKLGLPPPALELLGRLS